MVVLACELPGRLARFPSYSGGLRVSATSLRAFAGTLLLITLSLAGAEVQIVKGHVPRAVAGLRPLRRLESTKRIDLAVGLPLRNRDALAKLLDDLYNPASPNYHKYLTSQQFAERFGPTEEAYQTVVTFANSNHFVVTGTHPNRMLLDVNGSAADIERALHLTLRVYQHPTEQRTFYSPDVEPSLDSHLPILSIAGLDNFFLSRPMDLRTRTETTPKPALDATGSGPSGTFIGRDFRAAYAPGVLLDGAGESVGLFELDSYYASDIADYENIAALPQVPLTNVLVNGFNRTPGQNNGEVALDIEMAISMAPGLSSVIVYEGSVGNSVLNRMATDNQARQLSCSWSFGKQVDATREQIFQQFAAQGQSLFQASGDAGAYGQQAFPPADDPWVTAVGGTALTTTSPSGAWASEMAWFAGGGGVSANYSIPSWQKPINMVTNLGSTTMRNVPDVAALADATIWVISNNGEQSTTGGTSAAAPLWAGFAALVNQQATANHQPGIGFINPAIYAIGQGTGYSAAFHDITSGNNTTSASPDRFYAVAGYDLCTGWGTPTGSNLVNALLAPEDALLISPSADLSASGPVGGPFSPALQAYSLTNRGTGPISWSLAGTSNWLNLSPSGGTLVPGGPVGSVQVSLNLTAQTLAPGTYVADLWFTNLNDGFYQKRRITLDILTPPVITGQPASQTLPEGSAVQFIVQTATNALLFYQWQANGTNLTDADNVEGSSTSMLTLTYVAAQNNGAYSVIVSNSAGSVASTCALLTVTSSAPVILVQPVSQTALPGANVTFVVGAAGTGPVLYQWRGNGTNLIEGGHVLGSRTSALTLIGVSSSDARTYSVVLTNALGKTTSAEAVLGVVSVTAPEIVQTSLYAFAGGADGRHPNGLTRGRDGRLYGTTQAGGASDAGTIFQLDASARPNVFYSFTGTADGDRPNGGLVQSADGRLFGTAYGGGTNGFGTVFAAGTNGQLNTLFSLDHTNGVLPTAGLVLGTDGNLYGTAYEGGIFHYGAVFRLTTNGSFETLFAFGLINGGFPHSMLTQSMDGNFYGTTYKGGIYGSGTVFKMLPNGALTTLASFNTTNGAFPLAGLTESSGGTFYGTTTYGGAFGLGTVFRLTRAGSSSNLVSFTGGTDGGHPSAALVQGSDGNLYGSTADGGAFGDGTVFRLSPDGGLTTICEFDGYNGANPDAPLTEAQDGSFYGTTQNGGLKGQGVIFRLSTPSAAPQITSQPADLLTYAGATVAFSVASFGSPSLSYQWQENGTNLADGPTVSGAAFRTLTLSNVSPANAGNYSVIITNSFGEAGSSQAVLQVLVSAPFISLQPTNQTLRPGDTAVLAVHAQGNFPLTYQWQANGTNLIDAGNLSGSKTDTLTITNVTEANNGAYSLAVTNPLGGTSSAAAVLSIIPVTAPGTRLSTLHWFSGGTDGRNPSELVDGLDGYLYGTAQFGGNFRDGTVFKIGTNGQFTTLFSFDQANGAFPLAGLILGTNGSFYGTTSGGGTNDLGTVFSISPAGALTQLHSFTGGIDGASPAATLAPGTDGNFYGSTLTGGAFGSGNLFKLAPDGTQATLYSFTGGADGNSTTGALLEGLSGDFYGTTGGGGISNNGSVFRLSPAGGVLTTLYSFTGGADGYIPVGSLVRGDDGAFYGATRYNTIRGFAFYGTLFKVTTNGVLSTLYALNFTDGSYPAAGLLLANDGNFYGTTEQGGPNDFGTLFRMTPNGAVDTLVNFDGFNDGANPRTALTQGPDGSLYGTTSSGGLSGHGTVFRLNIKVSPPALQAALQTSGTLRLAWNTELGRVYQLQSKPKLSSTNWVSVGSSITAAAETTATSVLIGSNAQQFYRVVLLP